MSDSEGSARAPWLLPAGIGLLIVVLVIVALVRDPVQLDPTTPEGTVQEYLQAISEDDYQRAFDVLHPEEFEGCVSSDISRYAPEQPFTANLESDAPQTDEGVAVVTVTLRFGTDGMFDSGWETSESFELVQEDDVWWITGEPWPHFTWECQQRQE